MVHHLYYKLEVPLRLLESGRKLLDFDGSFIRAGPVIVGRRS